MIEGRFGGTTGRPYLEGRIFFPRLKVNSEISFLVDTGADKTLLLPSDGQKMGINYSKLNGGEQSIGIGGITNNFVEKAIVLFNEPKVAIHAYIIDLQIASPSPENLEIPTLLA